ncbi:GAF domain-containing protein [Massilia agilis]|uniref:GAF domain-containing protein n=1 Tax=Massilia agilis TaxID=1811226 RepID=A0ABT2DEQ4_9BURK|nr:GAF domain-containing protein [Massilia agilis]MCS0809803.1 GAF domain-containing protein [Massilia agilis]
MKVDAIRACFEGVIPATMTTVSLDGTPNVAYLSQVQFVDSDHIALSWQFFNKTRANLLANPHAMLVVIDAVTAAQYRLTLEFLRTETCGPLFESMKAKIAGVASHVGMSGVFKLLGADVFRVHALEQVPGQVLPQPPHRNLLAALRRTSERIGLDTDLESLLADTLDCLEREFDIGHSMALLYDQAGQRLYTVASRGYEESGVGSEIPLGDGVIGVAARERTPIRIGHMSAEYAYNRAIRDNAVGGGMHALETAIPLPGLPESRSQLAVPMLANQRLIGVLYVESPQDLRFTYDDEDALVALANQLAMAIHTLQSTDTADDAPRAGHNGDCPGGGEPLLVRHYPENDSIFLGDDYLIKGVAGSIFAVLVRDALELGRTEFSNRELRLDPRIRLPDLSDNLEARLLLLARRLAERNTGIHIEKTGRGRFRLCSTRPLKLAS